MVSYKHIQDAATQLREQLDPERIVLFGSFAEETADEGSDIDLLVVMETDIAPAQRFALVRRVLASIPAAFDIIVKTPHEYEHDRRLVNTVTWFADRYGKVLYERRSS